MHEGHASYDLDLSTEQVFVGPRGSSLHTEAPEQNLAQPSQSMTYHKTIEMTSDVPTTGESMLHQTMQVHVASDTQKIQSFHQPK